MTNVFVLQHVHSLENGVEDIKLIGVYSSRENAQTTAARLARVSGFSDAPDDFHIDEYPIDRDHWVEGYVPLAVAQRLPDTRVAPNRSHDIVVT